MEKGFIKQRNKKKNILIRLLDWIVKGNKREAEKGNLCKS